MARDTASAFADPLGEGVSATKFRRCVSEDEEVGVEIVVEAELGRELEAGLIKE